MVRRTSYLLLFLLALTLAGLALSQGLSSDVERVHQSEAHRIRVEAVSKGFEHAWGMTFLPNGDALVTERPGRLYRVNTQSGERTRIEGLPEITARGQGGLLDVEVHPRFGETGWVYLSYVAQAEGGFGTHVGRGRLDGSRLVDFEVIFRAEPFTDATSQHFGSRLAFDPQGYLFISLGDRNERERAQDPNDHNGSLIRVHDDGSIPEDNPFVGRKDARPEIYSIGHRNIQGLAVHPETGRVWLHEHGPRGGDEINLPEPGKNYGWPAITHGREYSGGHIAPSQRAGLEQPIHQWTPSIAPSGMAFYTGERFPQWRGDLFVGALAHTHLARLRLDGSEVIGEERLLDSQGLRIRAVRQGPDGLLYLLVDDKQAPLLRLRPAD